jgi:hypothetical protein
MLPYAEEFLDATKCNQWFIRFFSEPNDLTHVQMQQEHVNWFVTQGLQLTQVRTHQFDAPVTNFYHVSFAGAQDVRLTAYSDKFENQEGFSLQPEAYQLYEWSYDAWCESGLRDAWLAHTTKLLTSE